MTSIGGDWTEATDPGSGRKYYANTVTNETRWEWPEEVPKPAGGGDDADWTEATDPGSGRKYYVNSKTNETSWTDPRSGGGGEATAADWTEATDPGSGRQYYVNTKTNETVWEKPAVMVEAEKAAGGGDAAAAPAAAAAAAPAAAAPAAAAAASGGGLSDANRARWKKIMDHVRHEAQTKITQKNNKFARLRNFVSLNKQKAPIEEVEIVPTGDLPSAKRKILPMLEVELPTPEEKAMEEYAEGYFNLNRKGLMNKKTTVEKILSWKADVIKTSLRKMAKDLANTATQAHKNITGFMGDRNTGKEGGGHAYKLLNNCLHAPEELRDEIYCQLVKQTTNNPNPDSELKGWQLIAICAGAFPPSKDFEPYLLSYCNKHKDDERVGDYAKFAMGRVTKTGELGPRREIPTAIEVEACKERNPVLVRVYHLDGTHETMPVTSWTTPDQLNTMMAAKLGIHNHEAFSVYEMTPEGEERFLEKDERLLDLVAYWQRLYEEEKGGKEKDGGITTMYRLVYKVHMYFDSDPRDKAAITEMFIQAVFDVVSSRYPCELEDCINLAALQLVYEQGAGGEKDPKDNLERYVPQKFIEDTGENTLALKVKEAHKKLGDSITKDDAMRQYLKYVKAWKIYGSSFFFVEPQMSHDLPDEVFLAVNPKGVLIINPDTKEVLAEHPYAEVPTWGHSGSSFVLHVGNLIRQTKLYFQTEQGKEINDLVRAYVNHLVVA